MASHFVTRSAYKIASQAKRKYVSATCARESGKSSVHFGSLETYAFFNSQLNSASPLHRVSKARTIRSLMYGGLPVWTRQRLCGEQ